MKTFFVEAREVHISTVKVEAETLAEAVAKVNNFQGNEILTEYSYTLGVEDWTAYTVDKDGNTEEYFDNLEFLQD